jgi:hypothetical protein
MEWCLDCHRKPQQFVRPPEAVFAMGWEPGNETPSAAELIEAHAIESKTDCSICHH